MRLAPRPFWCRLRPMLLGALAGAALVASCSDSTDPTPPGGGGTGMITVVTVQGVAAPVYTASPDGIAILSCDVSLSAKVNGNGVASWSGATFRFYPANDLRTAFDSVTFSAPDIADSWGGGSLSPGVVQGARWNFAATIPFTTRLDYRYRPAGATADSTASAQFTCQPSIPANPTPPAISALTIQPAGGTIEPGDTLTVTFTASAQAGLWQTIVALSGACDTALFVPGRLATSASYTVRFPVTRGCTLNGVFGVTVVAVDAAVKLASSLPQQFTVVDHTPPALQVSTLDGHLAVGGDYFTGDTLRFNVFAVDNDLVSFIEWEVPSAGVAESVAVNATASSPPLHVPVSASWGPAPLLQLSAIDRAGNRSTLVIPNTDSLNLHPAVIRPTAVQRLLGAPIDMRIDGRRGVFYVLLGNQPRLLTLRLSDATTIATLDLPTFASSLDFTVSGDSLVMACPLRNAVGVVDLTGPTPRVSLLPLSAPDTAHGQFPSVILVTANGAAFVGLTGPAQAQHQLLEVNLSTGADALRLDAGNGGVVENVIVRSADHDVLIVGTETGMVQLYNSSTDRFGPLTQPPPGGGNFGVSANGQVIADGLLILDPGLQLLRSVVNVFGFGTVPSFLTPDGQYLHYVTGGGLIRTRVSDGAIVDRAPLPIIPYGVGVSDDGQWASYFTPPSGNGTTVGVVDLR